jgi:hypothetical protein
MQHHPRHSSAESGRPSRWWPCPSNLRAATALPTTLDTWSRSLVRGLGRLKSLAPGLNLALDTLDIALDCILGLGLEPAVF